MKKRLGITALMAVTLPGLAAGVASAQPKLRVQVNQRGDFALLGNTLAQECRSATPLPLAGTVGNCGISTTESGPDVFWRADSPGEGRAEANIGIAPDQARTAAVLTLPEGARVTHAFLYWAARNERIVDKEILLHHEGGFEGEVTAIDSIERVIDRGQAGETHNYQSVADITAIVQQNGPGAYRVEGVDAVDLRDREDDVAYVGWWMAVFFEDPSAPPRNLALFDGLDRVAERASQRVELSGFKVPESGFGAKLGIVAYEGDNNNSGDSIFFNPTDPARPDPTEALSDELNPRDNFFNGTRSRFGKAVSEEGDLPRIPGTPQSMSGVDIDVVDVSSRLTPGEGSATLVATSSQELYLLAGWVTSISTLGPDFSRSAKVVKDLDGAPTYRGDTLEYHITATNSGDDDSIGAKVVDPLPEGVTFVPGSLQIVDGDGAGPQTDAPGDDLAEYDPNARTVTFRLGDGADSTRGGGIPSGASVTARFAVTVNVDSPLVISNQATITAAGSLGAPPSDDLTDGNGDGPGAPPTDVTVEPDTFYGAGSGVFGPCSAGASAGSGSAAWLAGLALAGLLRRRRRA